MAQPQEWTVLTWSAWQDRDNDGAPVRDQHGNFKGSVTFEEDRSEPIDATFKTQPEPGDKKFGTVDMYQTKAGKVRKGFKSAQRPNPAYGGGYGQAPQQAGQVAAGKYGKQDEHTQESIARSVALKAAVDSFNHNDPKYQTNTEVVLAVADKYLAWLQGSGAKESTPISDTPQSQQGSNTGAVNPARPWERISKPQPETMPFEGNEYPLDDVPPEYQ